MTRPFNIKYTCQHCGKQSTAETAFGRWMRNNPALDSVEGTVRTDMDHAVLRYKTNLKGKEFQFLQIIEVKEKGAEPRLDQVDILSFLRQIAERKSYNMHTRNGGKAGVGTIHLYSKMNRRRVNVKFFGVHLLQFENKAPDDGGWIKWDGKEVTAGELEGLICMERNPWDKNKWTLEFLRDRHRRNETIELFPLSLNFVSEPKTNRAAPAGNIPALQRQID